MAKITAEKLKKDIKGVEDVLKKGVSPAIKSELEGSLADMRKTLEDLETKPSDSPAKKKSIAKKYDKKAPVAPKAKAEKAVKSPAVLRKNLHEFERIMNAESTAADVKKSMKLAIEQTKKLLEEAEPKKEAPKSVAHKKSSKKSTVSIASKYATKPTAHKKSVSPKKLLTTKDLRAKYAGTNVDLERDSDRKARPFGKRRSKNGKTYYEHRPNRADVSKKHYPYLEKGGEITDATKGVLSRYIFEYQYPKHGKQPAINQKYYIDTSKEVPIGGLSEAGFMLKFLNGDKAYTAITATMAMQAIRNGEIKFQQTSDYWVTVKAIKKNKLEKGGKITEGDWFWNYDYRHYMRDASLAKRQEVYDKFIKAGLEPDGSSPKHTYIVVSVTQPKELAYWKEKGMMVGDDGINWNKETYKGGGRTRRGYEIVFSVTDEGMDFYNAQEEDHGEYKRVAHISDKGEVKYFIQSLPEHIKHDIEEEAKDIKKYGLPVPEGVEEIGAVAFEKGGMTEGERMALKGVAYLKSKGYDIDAYSEATRDAYFEVGDESIQVVQGSKGAPKDTQIGIAYFIEGFQEPVSKTMLRHIRKEFGKMPVTLYTNAGLEIHSKEMKGEMFEGIKIVKVPLEEIQKFEKGGAAEQVKIKFLKVGSVVKDFTHEEYKKIKFNVHKYGKEGYVVGVKFADNSEHFVKKVFDNLEDATKDAESRVKAGLSNFEEGGTIDEATFGYDYIQADNDQDVPADELPEDDSMIAETNIAEQGMEVPAHFGSGENIDVFGYQTQNFEICGTAVLEFENAIAEVSMDADDFYKTSIKDALKDMAVHIDAIFSLEKSVVIIGKTTKEEIDLMTMELLMVGNYNGRAAMKIDTRFLNGHVWEIVRRVYSSKEVDRNGGDKSVVGKTIWFNNQGYTIAEWVYTQKEDYPIHRIEYHPELAAEIHPNGDIDIRELDAFDRDFASSFKEPSDGENEGTASFDEDSFLAMIYPEISGVLHEQGIDLDEDFNVSDDGGNTKHAPKNMWSKDRESGMVDKVVILYATDNGDKIGEILVDLGEREISYDFPNWEVSDSVKYDNGGETSGEIEFRKLAKSPNFDIIVEEGRFEVELDQYGNPKSLIESGKDHRLNFATSPIATKYGDEIREYARGNKDNFKGYWDNQLSANKHEKGGHIYSSADKKVKVYSSDNTYVLEVILDGKVVEEKPILANTKQTAREIAEDYHEPKFIKQYGDGVTFNLVEKLAQGGETKTKNRIIPFTQEDYEKLLKDKQRNSNSDHTYFSKRRYNKTKEVFDIKDMRTNKLVAVFYPKQGELEVVDDYKLYDWLNSYGFYEQGGATTKYTWYKEGSNKWGLGKSDTYIKENNGSYDVYVRYYNDKKREWDYRTRTFDTMEEAKEYGEGYEVYESGGHIPDGSIPNNYRGKTAEQVWDSWDMEQRKHFIKDHMEKILHEKDVEAFWEHYKGSFESLPERAKEEVERHISEGEYAKGGKMKEDNEYIYKDFYSAQGGIKFETEEAAEKFIKSSKPFIRKQLREGNFVLAYNGKEYYIGEKVQNKNEYAEGGIIDDIKVGSVFVKDNEEYAEVTSVDNGFVRFKFKSEPSGIIHSDSMSRFKRLLDNGTYTWGKYEKGGKIGFEALQNKVAKEYEGKSVAKKYQKEYGKTYSKEEAKEVGAKVAAKVKGIKNKSSVASKYSK